MNTEVDKAKLLEILRKNRETHHAVYLEACDGYREKVAAECERIIAEARGGMPRMVALAVPVDQTKEYDRAIGMFEMDVRTTITLEEDEFAQYVQDDWRWRAHFTASNSSYTHSAEATAYYAGGAE